MGAAAQMPEPQINREFLRHTVATLAYRGGKVLRDVPEGFAQFRTADNVRTPGEILAHVGDLLDWALSMAKGNAVWYDTPALEWRAGCERFYAALKMLDDYLVSAEPLATPVEALFQGPIADALTHIGQVAMLRRMAGAPVKGENYYRAEIRAGRVGPEQAAPRREFD